MGHPDELSARRTGLTSDEARVVVAAAAQAPSIHNTQPWRWRLDGGDLQLRADRGRQLEVADPLGRQLVVSCGASLFHAVLALRELGIGCDVARFPAAAEPDLLATIRTGGARMPSPAQGRQALAADHRHTDRRPFTDRPVPAGMHHELRLVAEREGAWVRQVIEDDDRLDLAVLVDRADRLESADLAYAEEVAGWVRAGAAPDGVPRAAAAPAGAAGRESQFRLRTFGVASSGTITAEPVERPEVLLLGTERDGPAAWLDAGCALAAILLTLTAGGLAASPLGQGIDLARVRERLSREAGGLGHIQMVLRIGYPADGDAPVASGRRSIDEIYDER